MPATAPNRIVLNGSSSHQIGKNASADAVSLADEQQREYHHDYSQHVNRTQPLASSTTVTQQQPQQQQQQPQQQQQHNSMVMMQQRQMMMQQQQQEKMMQMQMSHMAQAQQQQIQSLEAMNRNMEQQQQRKQAAADAQQPNIEQTTDSEERLDGAWEDTNVDASVNVASVYASTDHDHADYSSTWHEGLEEEVNAGVQYEEAMGMGGATFEELAAAWADAEKESEQNNPQHTITPYQLSDESKTLATTTDSTTTPNIDFMSLGMQHFQNGEITSAIRNFEAELHSNGLSNSTAWTMLGKCHAENDQDEYAISCLEQAIDHDAFNLDALLALGVSYVNELNHGAAISNLKRWVMHNPKYAGLDIHLDEEGDGDGYNNANKIDMDEVRNLLLQALAWDGNDVDVLQALGVCYNVTQDYDSAVTTFQKALDIIAATSTTPYPEQYQLWNKLGATLANSNRSQEALPAYHAALELKPKYARSWLNMAISHSNLYHYEEAARCYLQAISLNPNAVHCWSYLRIALTCLERWELLPLVANQDLEAFTDHFDFVVYD